MSMSMSMSMSCMYVCPCPSIHVCACVKTLQDLPARHATVAHTRHRHTSETSKQPNTNGRTRQGTMAWWAWMDGGRGSTWTKQSHTSQPRTGHTREPDPTHLKLRHRTTRGTATHERTHTKQTSFTHTHTPRDRRTMSEDDTARLTRTHTLSHAPGGPSPARSPPTTPPAPPPVAPPAAAPAAPARSGRAGGG